MNATTDVAVQLVAKAREAEAAFMASLAAGVDAPDTADDALFDAYEAIPSTVQGFREKILLALEVEGPHWPDDALMFLRSLLPSPVLAA